MIRGFRHKLFVLIQLGAALGAAVAILLRPDAWQVALLCFGATFLATVIAERLAARFLRRTLGALRRAADDIGRGRRTRIESRPGEDFHKLASAINLVAAKLADANEEERRLQEELRRRERLAFLGELAASVAHEINNPLDGVQNCVRILRRSEDDPQRAEQMLDLIESGLSRIDMIVRRLLTLAREHVIRPIDRPVREVVEKALQSVREKFSRTGITVHTHWNSDADHARIDPPLLEQVFVNLFRNAADSMPDGGELRITLRRVNGPQQSDQWLEIEVADTGEGIAPDVLPHIFEPFYTTKQGGRGTGLGLAIASRIVDAHDGVLDVESAPGSGTRMCVRLPPLTPERAADSAVGSSAIEAIRG